MPNNLRTIAIYGIPQLEIFHRPVEGAVRYCEEQGGFQIRDFRLARLLDLNDLSPPPWRGRADGVILALGSDEASAKQAADWVLSGGVPAVSVAADWFDPRVPVVYVDRISLAELATKHLIECGCKSFLYFGYYYSAGSQARATSMCKTLAMRGHKLIEVSSQHLYVGSYEDESAILTETELIKLLGSLKKPIGVWALNDNYARAVCLACEHLDLAVPGQVKVLGVDDLSIARMYHPTISSIRTPGEEVGYLAMRELHKMLDGKKGVRSTIEVKATELIERDSTSGLAQGSNDLNTALDYIARHACQGVTVDQLVKIVGTTRRTLEKRFQEQLGYSPGDEIRRVRLERAKTLLQQTDLSMSRIAAMIGYEETAAFSKFFRNGTGMSPRAFRTSSLKSRKRT